MPIEPDNNIEEQLKAWAAKRQAEADRPFDLHAATRRLLQDEVARSFPAAPSPLEKEAGWLEWLKPRLAFALSVVAMMVIVGLMFLPGRPKNKSLQESRLASDELSEAKDPGARRELQAGRDQTRSLAESRSGDLAADRETPALAVNSRLAPAEAAPAAPGVAQLAEKSKADGDSVKQLDVVSEALQKRSEAEPVGQTSLGRAKVTAADASPSGTQRAPSTGTARTREFAGGRYGLQQPRSDISGTADAGATAPPAGLTDERAAAVVAAKGVNKPQAPAAETTAGGRPAAAGTELTVASYVDRAQVAEKLERQVRVNEAERLKTTDTYAFFGQNTGQATQLFTQAVKYRRNFNSPPMPNVLAEFKLEQNGQQLRILDADGSVYEGGFVAPAQQVEALALKDEADAIEGKKIATSGPATDQNSTARNYGTLASGQMSSFRVAGTNRTLNQLVVFTANLIMTTNASHAGAGGGVFPQQTTAVLLRQSTVQSQATAPTQQLIPPLQGQAYLGDNEKIEISATPAGP